MLNAAELFDLPELAAHSTSLDLVTFEEIPCVAVGSWEAYDENAKPVTIEITPAELDSAVVAQLDPALPKRVPLIIGHDGAFVGQETIERPVVGYLASLRTNGYTSDQRPSTLLGNMVVPRSIATLLPVMTPQRSAETAWNYTSAVTGNTYSMCLTGMALLSDSMPAVSTLPELLDLWGVQWALEDLARTEGDDAAVVAQQSINNRLQTKFFSNSSPDATPTIRLAATPIQINLSNNGDQPMSVEPKDTGTPASEAGPTTPTASEIANAPIETLEPGSTAEKVAQAEDAAKANTAAEVTGESATMPADRYQELLEKERQFDDLVSQEANRAAETFADEMIAAGKAVATAKAQIAAQFAAAPEATKQLFSAVPASTPAPTGTPSVPANTLDAQGLTELDRKLGATAPSILKGKA